MALFGRKKEEKSAQGGLASGQKATSKVSGGISIVRGYAHVLKHARITEKATMHSAESVYTFDISDRATKRDVLKAVEQLYKVKPRMIRIVPVRAKMRRSARTGKSGMTKGGKKAYVYLKKGETITIS